MAFSTIQGAEASVQSAEMVECYTFTNLSTGTVYTFTSSDAPVTLQTKVDEGSVFTPVNMRRSSLQYVAKKSVGTLTLTMKLPRTDGSPGTQGFRSEFTGAFPSDIMDVQLIRAQRVTERTPEAIAAEQSAKTQQFEDGASAGTEYAGSELLISTPFSPSSLQRILWTGTVSNVSFDKDEIQIILSAVGDQSQRPVPGRKYSWACGLVWGGASCTVDASAYTEDVSFSSTEKKGYRVVIDSGSTAVTSALAADLNHFNGGWFQMDGDVSQQRFILAGGQDPDTSAYYFDVSVPIFDFATGTGTTFNASPGCDRSPDTCRTKYNNLENFGGFPHVPDFNPFADGLDTDDPTIMPYVILDKNSDIPLP